MAGRQRSTFQKRNKEIKRLEKRALKAEKRAARRLAKSSNGTMVESEIQLPVPEPGENSPADPEEAEAETL